MTTQNCAECGTRAEPGQSFCDACGAVLRWDQAGTRTAQPAASSPDQGPGGTGVPPARPGRTTPTTGAPDDDTEATPVVPHPRHPTDAPGSGSMPRAVP
ncbi:zinc ribbon domain-containing protein, partial [Streptomyces sp. NPDC054844]